jgi:hypothetical protein
LYTRFLRLSCAAPKWRAILTRGRRNALIRQWLWLCEVACPAGRTCLKPLSKERVLRGHA